MTVYSFDNIKIKGISSVVPPLELDLLNDKSLYDGDLKKIQRVINSSGFHKRRVADSDVMTSDMCCQAALDVLSKTNTSINDVDALLFISYTPDYLMPATSYVLHKRLNLPVSCITMDIPQACSGYVIGLFQASMLIQSGCKNVLLLVGDSFSKFSDMFNNHTAPVFGDAGSATLVSYSQQAPCSYFNIYSDGNGYDALICPNGGFRNPPKVSDFYEDGAFCYHSKMEGGRIFNFTIDAISPAINEIMTFAQKDKQDIDYFILHQANKFILQNIARQLELPVSRIPMTTISQYGNQCGASIPCTICDTIRQEVSSQKLQLLLSGFGVGLSWANALITTDKIYCSTLNNYEG